MFSSTRLIETLTQAGSAAASLSNRTIRYFANHPLEVISVGLVFTARLVNANPINTCPGEIVPFTCPTDIDLYSPYFDAISNLQDWHKANLFVFAQSHDVVIHESIAANMINYFSRGQQSVAHFEGGTYETIFPCQDYCLEEITLTHRILVNYPRDFCIPHIMIDAGIQCRGWEKQGTQQLTPELEALSKQNDIAIKQMPIMKNLLSECFDMLEALQNQKNVAPQLEIAAKMVDKFISIYNEYYPKNATRTKELTAQKKYFAVHLNNLVNKSKNTFYPTQKPYTNFLLGFNDMVFALRDTIQAHNQTQTEFTKKILPYARKRDQEGLKPAIRKSKKIRGKKFFTAGDRHILTNAGAKTLFARNTTHLLPKMKKVLDEQNYTVIAFKK